MKGKRKKRCVDRMNGRLQLTLLINGPGNFSDERTVINDLGNKYAKGGPFKELRKYPAAETKNGKR